MDPALSRLTPVRSKAVSVFERNRLETKLFSPGLSDVQHYQSKESILKFVDRSSYCLPCLNIGHYKMTREFTNKNFLNNIFKTEKAKYERCMRDVRV
jgi:hypothetical protein